MLYTLFQAATAPGVSAEVPVANVQSAGINLALTGDSDVSATVIFQGYVDFAWQTFQTFNLAGSQRVTAGGVSPAPTATKYRAKITAINGSLNMTLSALAVLNPITLTLRKVRRDLIILGDSFVANCHTITANAAYASENYGFAGGLAYLLGLYAPYTGNHGVVGDTTAGFLTRAAAAFSNTGDVIITPSMTNDRTDGTLTVDDTKANILKLLAMARAAGKHYCVGTGTPRFATKALTAQEEINAKEIRRWVLEDLSKLTVVCNEWDGYTQAMTVDDLHPNPLGRDFLAKRWASVLSANFDFGQPTPFSFAGQLYDAIKRPFGSQTANPLLAGSTLVVAPTIGADPASVIADGMTVAGTNFTGLTTLLTLEDAPVGKAQKIKLMGALTTAGGYLTYGPTVKAALANFNTGDVIEAMAYVAHSADAPCLLSWELEMIVQKPIAGTATTLYFRAMDKYQEPFAMEAENQGLLETMRYTIDKTETSITWRLTCYPANGVPQSNSYVKAWSVGLCKV